MSDLQRLKKMTKHRPALKKLVADCVQESIRKSLEWKRIRDIGYKVSTTPVGPTETQIIVEAETGVYMYRVTFTQIIEKEEKHEQATR